MTRDNNLLGEFELNDIPPAPSGVPEIEVFFEQDPDGLIKVSANNKGTGKLESITLSNAQSRLSQNEIERLIFEGQEFAEEDKAISEHILARNDIEKSGLILINEAKNEEGLVGNIDRFDKGTLLKAIEKMLSWLGLKALDATTEDFGRQEDQLSGVANPITSGLYSGGAQIPGKDGNDKDEHTMHDEL